MKNILNFFLSFDKLMKEKLILPFFWLAVIAWGMDFFATALDAISLGPLAAIVTFFKFFVTILLALVFIRLLCELAVAVFRINDNLSPDGGRSESADVDLFGEARKAAETAAAKAREAAKIATEKTKSALDKTKDAADGISEKTADKVSQAKAASAKVTRRTKGEDITIEPEVATPAKKTAVKKTTAKKADTKKTDTKKTDTKKTAPKKASARKTAKTTTTKTKTTADGVRLKKDGTPAKRPGPKAKD